MKERDLYEPVREFVEEEFNCFDSGISRGPKNGIIDVVGLRNNVSELGGHTEVISVEVKPENNVFLKALGQAYAYSIMAERCFLAIHKPYGRNFTQDEKDLASRVGVGLIKIGARKKCSIVESSPLHSPLDSYKLRLLQKLGYVRCVMCQTLFSDKGMRSNRHRSSIVNAIKEEKPLRYWLSGLAEQKGDVRELIYDRRHLCADCVQAFSGLLGENK